jgi:hypothetical protein
MGALAASGVIAAVLRPNVVAVRRDEVEDRAQQTGNPKNVG